MSNETAEPVEISVSTLGCYVRRKTHFRPSKCKYISAGVLILTIEEPVFKLLLLLISYKTYVLDFLFFLTVSAWKLSGKAACGPVRVKWYWQTQTSPQTVSITAKYRQVRHITAALMWKLESVFMEERDANNLFFRYEFWCNTGEELHPSVKLENTQVTKEQRTTTFWLPDHNWMMIFVGLLEAVWSKTSKNV